MVDADGEARASQLRLLNVQLQEDKGQLARRNEELERQNEQLRKRAGALGRSSLRCHAAEAAGREQVSCEVPGCGWRGTSLAVHQGKAKHGVTYRGGETASAKKRRMTRYRAEVRARPRAPAGDASSGLA